MQHQASSAHSDDNIVALFCMITGRVQRTMTVFYDLQRIVTGFV